MAMVAVALGSAARARTAEPAQCQAPTGDRSKDVAEARRLFDQALGLEPAEPEAALRTLFCAERLTANAAVALRIGTIAERLGRYAAAAAAFERYLARAGAQAPDAEQMRERIRVLRDKAAAPGPGPVPEPTPPPGPEAAPAEPGAAPGQELAGWVLGAGGLALGITGIVLLGVAKAQADRVHDIEPGTVAWDSDEARGRFETAEIEQTLGIVGVVVGGTAVALGVVLLATADGSPQATATLGPNGLGASLRVTY